MMNMFGTFRSVPMTGTFGRFLRLVHEKSAFLGGWVGGWVGGKAVLRIAGSNQK